MMEASVWIGALASVLEEFSSEEFQNRVWLRGEGPECSSYVEAMCNFFDDFDANRLIDVEWRQLGLTESQRGKLALFRDVIKEFDKDISDLPYPKEVMDNPKLRDVRQAALDALAELRRWRPS